MARRLQVTFKDAELLDIERAARLRGMSIADWVRQALVHACGIALSRDVAFKLEAIRRGARMNFPAADIDRMLEESGRRHA